MENFENWNKNVRNKNSDENLNQRDYDKEPIILTNYSAMNLLFYILVAIIIPTIFIKILYNYGAINLTYGSRSYLLYNQNSTFILSILFLIVIATYSYFAKKESDIIINNSYITYFGNNLKGFEIKNINKNSFIMENHKIKINLLCLFFVILSLIPNFDYQGIIFAVSFIFVRFFPIFLFSFWQNKGFYNPRFLSIKTKSGGKTIIPLVSQKDTIEVREYFLKKLNIDISNKINYFM
ncbi:hypothetical protein OFO03_01685 [Campylobacter sp. JMF_02 ED1]|uniref:hypothetical protein n=1 Tax=unclassified Campylobacter TaxID=2593542 RepID=UPI0022E9C946|nr:MULTISPECIES: hypothetical protein [unclassified Campylobacter]MDA3049659.1 hypothetical protein [Campylobacter sp. JMF_15 NE4]MDA3050617.1 hypothetical protein [Campylobacter sp. JMF_02 ED1]